jgi:hypothetical protein
VICGNDVVCLRALVLDRGINLQYSHSIEGEKSISPFHNVLLANEVVIGQCPLVTLASLRCGCGELKDVGCLDK